MQKGVDMKMDTHGHHMEGEHVTASTAVAWHSGANIRLTIKEEEDMRGEKERTEREKKGYCWGCQL